MAKPTDGQKMELVKALKELNIIFGNDKEGSIAYDENRFDYFVTVLTADREQYTLNAANSLIIQCKYYSVNQAPSGEYKDLSFLFYNDHIYILGKKAAGGSERINLSIIFAERVDNIHDVHRVLARHDYIHSSPLSIPKERRTIYLIQSKVPNIKLAFDGDIEFYSYIAYLNFNQHWLTAYAEGNTSGLDRLRELAGDLYFPAI